MQSVHTEREEKERGKNRQRREREEGCQVVRLSRVTCSSPPAQS